MLPPKFRPIRPDFAVNGMGMRILDLYCGAGGAARGYFDTWGCEIVGIDNRPQPNYPYRFIRADAASYPLDGFDFVHASPPCQMHSRGGYLWDKDHGNADHLWMTIKRLREWGGPYVVENVEAVGYPLADFRICGSYLDCITRDGSRLFMVRHRKFWSSHSIPATPCTCKWRKTHGWQVASVFGSAFPKVSKRKGRDWTVLPSRTHARELMGIDWMTDAELAQAVPPRYTAWIAHQLNP